MNGNNRLNEIMTNFSNWFNSLSPDMQQRVSDRLEGMLFTLDLKIKKEKDNAKGSNNE